MMNDSSSSIVIRPATEADLDAVLDLLTAVAAEDRWIATEPSFDRGRRRAVMQAVLERADAQIFVATVGDGIVGHVGVSSRYPGLMEFGMAVSAARRGSGIGSALLTACINWSRAVGAHKIILEVFPHNAAARTLYAKFGFQEEGYFRRHLRRRNGTYWDSIPMGLLLDEPLLDSGPDTRTERSGDARERDRENGARSAGYTLSSERISSDASVAVAPCATTVPRCIT